MKCSEEKEEEEEEEEGLPALVIISSSDTESFSGCVPLVVWLKETSWLSFTPPGPPPAAPDPSRPTRDGFRRGSMSSSNCSKKQGTGENRLQTEQIRS